MIGATRMSTELTPISPLTLVGQIANAYAAQTVFTDYHERIAPNTLRRQTDDLCLFSAYLSDAGLLIAVNDLLHIPGTWGGISHGLVSGFVRWMLGKGYAIGSINVRLSTVKAYAKLAARAGVLFPTEYALIKLVEGYSHAEGRNIDQGREATRKGDKKSQAVSISSTQAALLKNQPDTHQGRRDAFLMCLLLDHGLRCGEVAALIPNDLSISSGTLKFYRQKVDKVQIHHLTRDTLHAALRYNELSYGGGVKLLLGSRKGGKLEGVMGERAITERVRVLGEQVGLVGLSAHDARHYWVDSAIKGGTDIKSLQDAGGWSSPAMPLRYAASNVIANQGVKLG